MNITKEITGEQTATIRISMQQADIEPEVTKALKDYQRKASVPGFRPGKVPFGMVKKMYGNSVMADQVNKTISNALNDFITGEKLSILGHPVANIEKTGTVDFDHQTDYDFYFDIGIAPEFDLNLSKIDLEFTKITAGEKQLAETIQSLLDRNPVHTHPEIIGENDQLEASVTETDDKGQEKENGFKADISFALSLITDDDSRNLFLGKTDGAEFVSDLEKAFGSMEDLKKVLKWPENSDEIPASRYNVVIKEIHRDEKAELNQEFFERIFPGQNISDEEAFKAKLTEDINRQLEGESERFFAGKAIDGLVEKIQFNLPEEFMKTWMLQNAEGKLTREKLDEEYVHYDRTFRWQLIESKLIEAEPGLYVTEAEIRDQVKKQFFGQFMNSQEVDDEMNKRMEPIVDMILKNQEEARKIGDQLAERKIAAYIKEKANVSVKEMNYDAFIESINPQQ
jgi:trigger factor